MELKINKTKQTENVDFSNLIFGKKFTDHMFQMENVNGKWQDAQIKKFENFTLSPATMAFHYSQSVFEGMKAFVYKGDKIAMVRPEYNFKRLNKSCRRMVIPEFDENFILDSLKKYLEIEKNWVPTIKGGALYIRPTIINTEALIKLKPSDKFLFYIISAPVGPYYKDGFGPTKIYVETEYVRAVKGGTGDVKAAANYGVSMIAAQKAIDKGYVQSLWLDAIEKKYVEEVGSMNIFFVYKGEIFTPNLTGTVLEGVTRDCTIKLAQHLGYKVHEAPIDINWAVENIENGNITEVFGTGTAAVVSPVGLIGFKGKDYEINGFKTGEVCQKIYEEYTGIQYGTKEDIFNWLTII